MAKFVPLSREKHHGKNWNRVQTYTFAARDPVAPLVGLELATAAVNMPIGFIKPADTYYLAAILSFRPNDNLFVGSDGRWVGSYIPAIFRAYPFRFLRQEGSEKMVLAVDEESGLIGDDGDEILFDDGGQPSRSVKEIMNFLEQLERSRVSTDLAVKALADAGVIASWEIKVQDGERQVPVSGIHRVDEAALNRLDHEAFLKLREVGALAIAYAQIISMTRLEVMSRLAEFHQRAAQTPGLRPENLFKMGPTDTLRFD
jgi:hypothetical protein